MKAVCHLVFDKKGVVKVSKGTPSLRNGQYAVRLVVHLPDSLFKPDMPVVEVTVPERELLTPTVEVVPLPVTERSEVTPAVEVSQ
jgi:hypothetical protein